MGQTHQDDTRTELSKLGEPGLTTRLVEEGIQQQLIQVRPPHANKSGFAISVTAKYKLGSRYR